MVMMNCKHRSHVAEKVHMRRISHPQLLSYVNATHEGLLLQAHARGSTGNRFICRSARLTAAAAEHLQMHTDQGNYSQTELQKQQ
jgi:hypothetical protein